MFLNFIQEKSTEILALITMASHDNDFKPTLTDIYDELVNDSSTASLLDPLNALQPLLGSSEKVASNILDLMGKCCNAMEIVIGVQEAVEQLEHQLATDIDDEQVEPNGQLLMLIGMYAAAIPRLKFGKEPVSETLKPIVIELASAFRRAGLHSSREEGSRIMEATADLVVKLDSWAKMQPDAQQDEIASCRILYQNLLDSTVMSYGQCLQTSLATRTFTRWFPRLSFRSVPGAGWQEGQNAINAVLNSYNLIGFSAKALASTPSLCHFVLLAHCQDDSLKTIRTLSTMLPIIINCIRANHFLDECVSFLLDVLCPYHAEISEDISMPLCAVLPSLASTHPDSSLRHQTFRVLSLILSLSPPPFRLQVLKDLCSTSDFPQMRVAAVGLMKEAVLEAFGSHAPSSNLFASPRFLQVLGPILFRPNPPDFFSSAPSLTVLEDSSEPTRLVECLALLYVLILQDKKNQTGIRDRDNLKNIDRQLLEPIRRTLSVLLNDPDVAKKHVHAVLPLVALNVGIERLGETIKKEGLHTFN
ncbi:uncharacterized protein BT62DRAFT_1030506 [Guyanagaster necrorhizus]|uniref:ARM repeat superfamily protein n=1 Tax=Guyanagaster necrorhizus TaxID=856835 RepID=A0A9P7VQM0_9AGAR|nr:uncharacterized protein BT62DRAFT_1030506 [Guyanagaster necrorhizus MCA 3950]KAG7444194.1 hypothetical protein BT62DRAFT_1030506 [Guyanagaster necrorhizus MCA 3950]